MKIFFYFGHPAQFHFYKNIINTLKHENVEIFIYIKSKDVLYNLVKETGWHFLNVSPGRRGNLKVSIILSLLKRDIIFFWQALRLKPDLMVASDPSFSHAAFLLGIPCLNFIDDDYDSVGYYAGITYPFTKTIITPACVRVGKWENKRVAYSGYMKLAYLHPNWFMPDIRKIGDLKKDNYFLIRLSGLSAHHDKGMEGISPAFLKRIINKLSQYGKVVISAEDVLDESLIQYKLSIPASEMHHYLYHAGILISDSQSMSGEAAVLGTPSIRISSFKDKLSVLDELEYKYGLTFAFMPEQHEEILDKIDTLLHHNNLEHEFQSRRQCMLDEKIDVVAFATWFIKNYPQSLEVMNDNSDYQYGFR